MSDFPTRQLDQFFDPTGMGASSSLHSDAYPIGLTASFAHAQNDDVGGLYGELVLDDSEFSQGRERKETQSSSCDLPSNSNAEIGSSAQEVLLRQYPSFDTDGDGKFSPFEFFALTDEISDSEEIILARQMRDQLKDLAGNSVLPANFSSDEKLDAKSVMFEILETLDDGGRQQRIANCKAIEAAFGPISSGQVVSPSSNNHP